MLPSFKDGLRVYKSQRQHIHVGFWNVPLVVYFNDKFEFLYVTWEFYIRAAENLHGDYFLLHYYDIFSKSKPKLDQQI